MTAHHIDEERITFGSPDGNHVADDPDAYANEPKAQTQADCAGERAV